MWTASEGPPSRPGLPHTQVSPYKVCQLGCLSSVLSEPTLQPHSMTSCSIGESCLQASEVGGEKSQTLGTEGRKSQSLES